MKLLLKILITFLVLYLCYSLLAQVQVNDKKGTALVVDEAKKNTGGDKDTFNMAEDDSSEAEEDFFSYDQDFLTRKLFQRKLPPLSRKERIIWSFRMAETNAFL